MFTGDQHREKVDQIQKPYKGQRRQSNRAKRAVLACNYCRSRRIKCQSHGLRKTCQNCIKSGSACEYSDSMFLQNWLDRENISSHKHSGKLVGKAIVEAVNDGIPAESSKRRESLKDEDVPTRNHDFSASQIKNVNADSDQTNTQDTETSDGIEKSLIRYLIPMITGCNFETPILPPQRYVSLPKMSLSEKMVDAYFAHVDPIYPILDDSFELDRSKFLSLAASNGNSIFSLLLRIIVCTGAACLDDRDFQGNDIKYMRESLFSQVLSEAQLIHSDFSIVNVQIMILITIYCWQTERLNMAWLWCGWAIRKVCHLEIGLGQEKMLEIKERVDFLKSNLFILESQLSVLQFRDDSKLKSKNIEEPSLELKGRYPVFFFRVRLARLVNKFSMGKSSERQQSHTSFYSYLKDLSEEITVLRDSIPLGWRPEHEICVNPTEHPCVFALHLEYHVLHMQIFTARKAHAKIAARSKALAHTGNDTKDDEKDQIISFITSARRIFQILGGIKSSPRLNAAMKWLSPSIHLLGAFQVLYAFVILHQHYISASSDVQLLDSACSYFETGMVNVSQGPEILAVMQKMHAKASIAVRNASGSFPPTLESAGLSDMMIPNTPLTTQTANHWYESLLFGYDDPDLQWFQDLNGMEMGIDIGAASDTLDLDHGG